MRKKIIYNFLSQRHQVRHICKAHKADTQKLTLQKSLLCSKASGTLSARVDTYIQFKSPRRRANIQQGVCCYAGRRIYSQLHIAINPYPADGILSAFVVIFIISFSISSGSRRTEFYFPTFAKPCSLPVMHSQKLTTKKIFNNNENIIYIIFHSDYT